MVSFWVTIRTPLPLGAKLVSFWMVWYRQVLNGLTWPQLVSLWVAYQKTPPKGLKWSSNSEWCGFTVTKAVSVGLNWSQSELHSLSPTHTMLRSSHSEGLFPNRGRLHTLWKRRACYTMLASINSTECLILNVIVTCLLQNCCPYNVYPRVFNVFAYWF